MPKEWILNQANMRRGLTKKSRVGPVLELKRKFEPKTFQDWQKYYMGNAYSKEHLERLGEILYLKVTDVCKAEIEDITEEDCIHFIYNLVINKTFDGYQSKIHTIYGQLQKILDIKIEPLPDEWDRGYNVDYFMKVNNKYIGLQIKLAGYEYITQIINEREQQEKTHEKFTEKYDAKVFYIISITSGKNKIIYNTDIIEEIKGEIERLTKNNFISILDNSRYSNYTPINRHIQWTINCN